MTTTKFKTDRRGRLAEDPRGAHVVCPMLGRTFLGEVTNVRFNGNLGYTVLQVRHFNGEMWPFEPCPSIVDVLVRTFDDLLAA